MIRDRNGDHMRQAVIEHLEAHFRSLRELVELLPEAALGRKLDAPSNTVGGQLWCVVGARESYAQAIRAGVWAGFNCSMSQADCVDQRRAVAKLGESAEAALQTCQEVEWTPARDELLLSLLEHEVQHQGQLIRYVYALGYSFPDSWKKRWALSDHTG